MAADLDETPYFVTFADEAGCGDMFHHLLPGMFVRHSGRPDWGLGQIQSVDGFRITVNFTNAGKQLINGEIIELETADAADEDD